MTRKPTYEELLQKVKELEEEKFTWKKKSFVEARNSKSKGTDSADQDNDFLATKDNLGSIIDVDKLQSIMDDFHKLTGMVTAILDMEGNVIESTGWQDICTKFHRVHPITKKNCTESDLYLVKNIKYGEYIEYQCKNGLWDVVTPLYIGNKHVGNIYTGQFFYEGDPVDENKFIKQADTYGFDKELYLDAFRRIPRYNRKTIKDLMSFLVKFTSYVSNVSYSNLKLETEIYDRTQAEDELRKSEQRFQRAMNASQDGIYDWDLETKDIYYSPGWKRMLGYEPDELPNDFSVWEKLTHPDDLKSSWNMMNEVIDRKRDRFEIEFRMKHKNGHWVDILSRSNLYTDDLNGKIRVVGTHVDISEIKKIERELRAKEEEHYSGPHCQDSFLLKISVNIGRIIRSNFIQFPNAVFNLHFLYFNV